MAPRPEKVRTEVETIASAQVYANPWLRVREDRVRRPDGSMGMYAVVEKPDFAVTIPILHNGSFCLVQQFRYPVRGRYWEFPQGSWEERPNAPLEDVAAGELREETGLHGGTFTRIGRLYEAYGYAAQAFEVFVVTGCVAGAPARSPEESDMVSAMFSRSDVERMLRDGEIRDGASAAAYGLFLLRNVT